MGQLDSALALAAKGFHVFPCVPNGKTPAIKDFPSKATRDPEQIERWFRGTAYNIGISTSKFGDNQCLLAVDVDNKNGKNGDARIFELEMEGQDFPVSYEQSTPTGGRHIIYVTSAPIKQGVDVLGEGLDTRGRGGYVLGAGSVIDGKYYRQINGHAHLAPAPQWLVERLGVDRRVGEPLAGIRLDGVDADRAVARAVAYLKTAPVSVEGQGGDVTAYKVAAKLKDLGCTQQQAFELMDAHWNPECLPPWDMEALAEKVVHAYRYGREPQGSSAPEAIFPKVESSDEEDEAEHPVDALNKEYAFIKDGAFVLQETTDEHGQFTTLRLSPADMHAWFANKTLAIQGPRGGMTEVPLSKLWMQRRTRREYDRVVFSPERDPGARFYNLWRGFSVQPQAGDHPSVAAFKEHALKNVCNGDEKLCRWLLGYFAHMIQKPYEKPLTALVFRGRKGTGKNALVERVGQLLGPHFMVADDDRYLLGNFNSHLESNLFFVLDEASWAGDKRAEGRLKGIITGQKHTIERKGAEPYKVDNLTRVAIIGNEDWIVPASQDERRFAVFTVGDGNIQDRKFFQDMRVGMENGGYAHLLHFLQTYDLTGIDVNDAPKTKGLIDQKHQSLQPVDEWWLDCISADRLVGDTFDGPLPERLPVNRVQTAFHNWAKARQIRSRLPREREFNKLIKGKLGDYKRTREGDHLTYAYHSPGIAVLRAEWETYIGGTVQWDTTSEE